ncbi:hypothetical protein MSG28_007222 [Choristoneura fumiferana]|uniref:Uncharacterized protein n=1 Tax=Choristoneura fumiferana TaxID=7141 RepID=A0ACC0JN12_CHOFU|nr:hypothetical protein MSG28_007222 [Choristoneura fumiferana]
MNSPVCCSVHGMNCPEVSLRAPLWVAAAILADVILTETELLHLSAHTRHVAEKTRRDVIQPYMEAGQAERAAVLAEKFKDFELLVEMCVQQDDMDRLYSYIDKYAGEVAAARARRAWCARWGPLRGAAAGWLARAPPRRPALALHHLAARDYASAASLLAALAVEETDSVDRMTTTASLAKLCLLASDESHPSELWNKVESSLSLGEQHAALPRDIKLLHGLDTEDCRVLPAEDLVQMYIESESDALTEYDYKKALDLTDFVADMERRDDLRLRVWCACIRRSSWEECNIAAPAAELQDKMFFRLMHLVHVMGGDLELLLPPAEDILTARELAELVSDSRFRYLVKFGYECFQTAQEDASEA